ncbi:amino acid adenylation domain-containing protein [Streptomyces sp. DH37]|uniref:amino acid adenylation domain-containing protein n=1 Tax=Streptomyces sp. DH37 TaxID=3040122 RepID=UPI0024410222|nr:amino acid adenylation domain-containing protein [Streptomyces sp. DH37]MDG9705836.1 amino acid adenylation domain-containing protein [Streptomyces sp. DH37]
MSIFEQDAVAALTPARRTVVHSGERTGEGDGKAPGAVCHALGVRLAGGLPAGGPQALARRFADRAAALLPAAGTAALFRGAARLWTEQVPCRSDASAAQRWRAREMARPVAAPRDAPVRGVLLQYADGVADLVVVAHRAALGAAALRGFVAELLGGAPPSAGREDRAAPAAGGGRRHDAARCAADLAECHLGARLDWGLGRPHDPDVPQTALLPLPAGHPQGDAESWTAALGVVLARYEGAGRPVLAALVTDTATDADTGTATGAPVEGIALVPVAVDGANTLGTLDKHLRAALAAGPAWHTEELRREVEAAGGDLAGAAAAGLVFADHDPAAGLPGAAWAQYLPFQHPPFPVTVSVVRDAAGNRMLRCDFSPRKLSADIADQFLRHVCRVHALLREAPDTPVPDVRLLDEDELDHLDALGRPGPAASCVPRRIDAAVAAVAASRPDAVAVCCGDTRISYGELDGRADRLAHALRRLGVADGDRVGVCLERSAELVVTLLAVLKAGATYVPMDPAHPRDRLSYTTADAALATVVTDHAAFPGGDAVRVVGTAELAQLAPARCEGPPPSAAGPHDPAYVIYTSGSTGRPKGVVVPHANVLALMAATTGEFGLGGEDTWTLFHSSAFDFSVWEIWGCLLTGGRLVVVPYWVSRSPEDFHRLLLREEVSVLSQTPSAFAQLVEVERDGADPAPVRLVVFGGEGLDPRMLLPWFDRHPESGCRVVNMYGITETTVHVTAQTVTRAEALAGSRSVGRALPGWWVRVADAGGRPLPVGVAGEIYVGGAGVASHYLNQPELTGQRFLTDPRTGERMYRSGDQGRLLPDGRLEHLGRLDSQVKLRGFRIELDEIRSVLLDDPQVTAAAVVLNRADPDDAATAQLDAFVVMDGEDTAAVRQRAARFLPAYMVPTTITALDRMPLTTNGKLDTRRLPRPAPAAAARSAAAPGHRAADPGAGPGAEGAGGAFEAALLEVWQEVLGVPVGPDDNFFDLGGNSLLAMRVGAALRRRGDFTVAMRDLYLRPTIRRLAADRLG